VDVNLDRGGTIVRLHMARHNGGIRIDLKLAPIVEDFFKQWAQGAKPEAVDNYGRNWLPVKRDSRLLVYSFPTDHIESSYTIWHPGRNLSWDGRTNISFLRLAGASSEDGISFTVDDLVSKSELENVAERVKRGCGWFYTEYIKPTGFDITLEARESR
jgi:hypothetical protein